MRRARTIALIATVLTAGIAPATFDAAESEAGDMAWTNQLGGIAPLVIGHRGACGYRPEHTLASYALAIDMGADYIEPDLVMTKDGVLIARHENELSMTTDVAEKFPERKTKKTIDGKEVEGWFSEDLTLAEIKSLRAREGRDKRTKMFDGVYEIPTFVEVIELAQRKSAETGRPIGLYPETKHPTYFDTIGLSLEEPLVATLKQFGYTRKESPVFIQSFETQNLKDLSAMTEVRLIQLLEDFDKQSYDLVVKGDKRTYRDLMTPEALKEIATYADGIGPWKRTILTENADKTLKPANSLIADAHAAGLFVHAYTFRDEPQFLAPDYEGDPAREYQQVFALGLDGVFSDFPDSAVRARARMAGR
jgi:glycerophosphoryl diester phosphodiesterase